MTMQLRTVIGSLSFCMLPNLHAQAAVPTGVTGAGPAAFLFTVAGALLLTLVLRAAASDLVAALAARIGTVRVVRVLKAHRPAVLHDFTLPGAYGGLVKIEHAVLTAGGILCILTVHCKGLIFGGVDDPQWSVVDGTVRHRFLNPLIQNESRLRALQQAVPEVPIAGVVVFTGRVDFSSAPPPNVIHVSGLHACIDNFVFGHSNVEDFDAVWLTLRSAAVTDAAGRKDLQTIIT
jgi:hypothetical protein